MNQLILNNCNTIFPIISDQSCDAIIIDPPYEIQYETQYNSFQWNDNKILDWNFLFTQYKRILKNTGNLIIFQGWSNVCETINIGKQYFMLKNWIIWARIKCRGAKTNFGSDREDILWFNKSNNYTFNKIYSNTPKKTGGLGLKNGQKNRSLTNVWYDLSPVVPWSQEYTSYPCQKPIQLMERIITIFTNPGDLILDSFCGSGSTLIAAKNLGRNYIGIDNNPEAIKICENRLNACHI